MAEATGGRGTARALALWWRRLNWEQRAAGIGAGLLVVSTFGPFSFVEAAEVLVGLGVLALLRARAERKRFHLPFGDGTAIAAAGIWAALLIVVRLFDRPLGQNLLAIACAAILVLAGARERAKRPADDLPPDDEWLGWEPADEAIRPVPRDAAAMELRRRQREAGRQLAEAETEPLPPPEYEPPSAP